MKNTRITIQDIERLMATLEEQKPAPQVREMPTYLIRAFAKEKWDELGPIQYRACVKVDGVINVTPIMFALYQNEKLNVLENLVQVAEYDIELSWHKDVVIDSWTPVDYGTKLNFSGFLPFMIP